MVKTRMKGHFNCGDVAYLLFFFCPLAHLNFESVMKEFGSIIFQLKIAETNVILSVFKGVICVVIAYTVPVTFCCSTGTRTAIFWSVTVYNKNIPSQCNAFIIAFFLYQSKS